MTDEPPTVPTTTHACAARDPLGRPCRGVPSIPCPKCLLVAYCSPECRKRDWRLNHKSSCLVDKPPRPRQTDGAETCIAAARLWCRNAATDIVNLEKNEGRYFDDCMQLLLVGEAGLRHLIYSVDKLPETASPSLTVCINEMDTFNLARTYFALHLLWAHDHDPVLNAEAVIHLWYSTRMPKALHDHINSVARKEMVSILDNITCFGVDENGEPEPYRSKTKQANLILDVELHRSEWIALKTVLDVPSVNLGEVVFLRYLDATRNTEDPQRSYARMTPARFTGMNKWISDGLLLPYGQPRDGFDTVNPLLFGNRHFQEGATAEPLVEWPMEVLDHKAGPALNDVYGKMFWYLRDLLVRFQRRVSKMPVKILLTRQTGDTLPQYLSDLRREHEFDRIEIGTTWDTYPLMAFVLFAKLLRHEQENPFATMLALTRDSVTHEMSSLQKALDDENLDMCRPTSTVLDEYAPPVDSADDPTKSKRDVVRRRLGLLLWRNWDKFSSMYLGHPSRFAFASHICPEEVLEHRSVLETGFLGLALREKHIITRRWPNRLVHSRKDKPSLRDFNRWVSWPSTAPERWLEWRRFEDMREDEWLDWLAISRAHSRLTFEKVLEEIVSGAYDKSNGYDSDDTVDHEKPGAADDAVHGGAPKPAGDAALIDDSTPVDDAAANDSSKPVDDATLINDSDWPAEDTPVNDDSVSPADNSALSDDSKPTDDTAHSDGSTKPADDASSSHDSRSTDDIALSDDSGQPADHSTLGDESGEPTDGTATKDDSVKSADETTLNDESGKPTDDETLGDDSEPACDPALHDDSGEPPSDVACSRDDGLAKAIGNVTSIGDDATRRNLVKALGHAFMDSIKACLRDDRETLKDGVATLKKALKNALKDGEQTLNQIQAVLAVLEVILDGGDAARDDCIASLVERPERPAEDPFGATREDGQASPGDDMTAVDDNASEKDTDTTMGDARVRDTDATADDAKARASKASVEDSEASVEESSAMKDGSVDRNGVSAAPDEGGVAHRDESPNALDGKFRESGDAALETGEADGRVPAAPSSASESTTDANDWAAIDDWAEEVNFSIARARRKAEKGALKREAEKREAERREMEERDARLAAELQAAERRAAQWQEPERPEAEWQEVGPARKGWRRNVNSRSSRTSWRRLDEAS